MEENTNIIKNLLKLSASEREEEGKQESPKEKSVLALEFLDLSLVSLQDEDVELIANSYKLANLQKLSLLSSKLTDKAYMALRKSPHLNKLIETDLLDSKSWTGIVGFKLRDNRQNLLQDIWLSADPEESTPESQAPESSEESSGSDSEDSTEAAQANVVIHTSEESNSANENSESEQKK